MPNASNTRLTKSLVRVASTQATAKRIAAPPICGKKPVTVASRALRGPETASSLRVSKKATIANRIISQYTKSEIHCSMGRDSPPCSPAIERAILLSMSVRWSTPRITPLAIKATIQPTTNARIAHSRFSSPVPAIRENGPEFAGCVPGTDVACAKIDGDSPGIIVPIMCVIASKFPFILSTNPVRI